MQSDTPIQHKILTAKEVSERLRLPLSTVWLLSKKKTLRGIKVGKHWRYLESDIELFMNGMEKSAPAMHGERRAHPRINTEIPASLVILISSREKHVKPGRILNMGEGGVLFSESAGEDGAAGMPRFSDLKSGDPVKIAFQTPDLLSAGVELLGRVIHVSANGTNQAGIKFRGMSPASQKVIREYVG